MKVDGIKVHDKEVCTPPCPFHASSDHPLKDAPIHIRLDKDGLVERICEHGVGHDDPDSVMYMRAHGARWAGVHGCDGCCTGNYPLPDISATPPLSNTPAFKGSFHDPCPYGNDDCPKCNAVADSGGDELREPPTIASLIAAWSAVNHLGIHAPQQLDLVQRIEALIQEREEALLEHVESIITTDREERRQALAVLRQSNQRKE